MNCQIYCWDAEDKVLDIVEGSAPSKMEKKWQAEQEPVMYKHQPPTILKERKQR
jgi:hypothetical protein